MPWKRLRSVTWLFALPALAAIAIEILLVELGAVAGMAPWRIILLLAAGAMLASAIRSRATGEKREEKHGTGVLGYAKVLGPALALALFLRALVAEPFTVPTGSMLPSLEIGDHVYVHKLGAPDRGEVIVFDLPGKPGRDPLIKRVVGLPGEVLQMQGGILHLNAQEVPRCLVGEVSYDDRDIETMTWRRERGILFLERLGDSVHTIVHNPHAPPSSWGPEKVPEGQVFVMGDNRDNSWDSRSWGGVPLDLVIGRAFVIWWSSGPRDRPLRLDRMGHLMGSDPLAPGNVEAAVEACLEELSPGG